MYFLCWLCRQYMNDDPVTLCDRDKNPPVYMAICEKCSIDPPKKLPELAPVSKDQQFELSE